MIFKYGREQIPQLEAVVDAVGTVVIEKEGKDTEKTLTWYFGTIKTLKKTTDLLNVGLRAQLQALIPPPHQAFLLEDQTAYSFHMREKT